MINFKRKQNRSEKNSAKIFMKAIEELRKKTSKYYRTDHTDKQTKEEILEFQQAQTILEEKVRQDDIKNNFMSFVKAMWPEFIEGKHHKEIAEKFNKIAQGKSKRLIINMPPRHTKSEFASYLLPSWMVGREPKLKIIQTTHNAELAVRFGRKSKNLIDSEDYQKIFKTTLQEDSKAAGR